jgi:hypothetical protein
MIRLTRASCHGALLMALVALCALAVPSPALAAGPAVGQDKDPYAREATLSFTGISDPGRTVNVTLSCDSLVHQSDAYPFANPLVVSLALPGCEGYGVFDLWVTVRDGATTLLQQPLSVGIAPRLTLVMPDPAITGRLFTIDPQWPADYTPPAGTGCRWEFRWGDNRSLDLNEHDETFGTMLFDVPTADGKCAAWTFDLPWVPYRQYEAYVTPFTFEPDGGQVLAGGAYVRFTASVGGTGHRITTSSLPIVQVLPSTYTPVVGQPVTYTRYLVGGATAGTSEWVAYLGSGNNPVSWHQKGGSTFTITAWAPGSIYAGWDRMSGSFRLGAAYDPPVRYRDYSRPNTTAPVQRIATGAIGATVPVSLTWTGTDRGWGIATYQIERSTDGGAWTRILSAKVTTLSQSLAPGHGYRYRVRAIDKYGNYGYWDYGPTFRPGVREDSSPAITWSGSWSAVPDAAARGGSLHESGSASAAARTTFTGRDVAWIAERGPGHGRAKVYVDGVLRATVDLTATADAPARVAWKRHWSTKATHTVRIVVEGTAGRPTVDVDGFLILR